MAKRKSAASKTVASAMRRRKSGTLKSGSGARVRSRKQAIAIGLNEAREKGADVPARPRSSRGRKKSAKKSASSRTSSRPSRRSSSKKR
jgi:uncharacterized protein DUF6496